MYFFIHEWAKILEGVVDKWNVKYNVEPRPSYFSMDVYVPGPVFCQ